MICPLKNSSLENRRKNNRRRAILFSVVLIVVIFLLIGPLRPVLFFLAEPFWKVKSFFLNSSLIEYFKTKQNLISEREKLEQRLFLAGNSIALTEILQNENESLKELLGRKETKAKTVLAAVLVRPPQIPYDELIIDAGSDYDLRVGNKVLASGNVYIGEVTEVFLHTSKVVLYSSPGRKRSVLLGTNSVAAEAVGVGGGNFNISLSKEIEVKENDIVVMPSITSNVFGLVEEVSFKDKDSFQTILFKSPVNISELKLVEVIIE